MSVLSSHQTNLDRLLQGILPHCAITEKQSLAARHWSLQMPLTHGCNVGTLKVILQSEALLSQAVVGKRIGAAEALMGTTDDVFFYLGTFAYPTTECGFLFVHSLEHDHSGKGVATPFDSGAFASRVPAPAPYLDGVDFVRNHELPVPEYRQLLAALISHYAATPQAYLQNVEAFACHCLEQRLHPFGISGGDRRTSTFEVRIPQRVPLQPPHLLAVFVKNGHEKQIAELSSLHALGVRIERYSADPDQVDSFYAIRESCINFIEEYINS
ncbi:hypothetical protein HNQ64_001736 [Prosthecobacter dejongeii]|uniref:Uncharacterized protein n=2 Tax=Prosthecobacter dejongeii TaxID=48465 RepID=A0A7W8DPM9_9BACT|nr:hypothetical protein [Prosthecobacter dejongeii]